MQNEKCVTSSIVILSEMQRSRNIPCMRSAVRRVSSTSLGMTE